MLDIGGVIVFVGALLSASALVSALKEPEQEGERWQVSSALLRSSLSLGVLFSLMFLFRRWYVFAAAGVAFSLVVLILFEFARSRDSRGALISRSTSAATLLAFSALPLLCWVLFAWSRDFGQHDYSKLYASYQLTLGQDLQAFRQQFGIVAPLLCLVGGLAMLRLGKGKRLLFLLTVSTCVAALLFLSVQSPGRHHYFLLMPLLGTFLAGLSLLTARRFGFMASVCLTLVLIMGGALATRPMSEKYGVTIFAGFDDWEPRRQKYAEGFAEVTRWLDSAENVDRRFCLIASSVTINQGIFDELWQILPNVAQHAYDQRMIHLGQVDSVDGPPVAGIKECEIFLVGVPFQAHLSAGQQTTLEIVQTDLVGGTGIGRAVEQAPKVFPMGDGIEIRGYRTRKMTNEEYDDLVRRFQQAKMAPTE